MVNSRQDRKSTGFVPLIAGALLAYAAIKCDIQEAPKSSSPNEVRQTDEILVESIPRKITEPVNDQKIGEQERFEIFAEYIADFEGRRGRVYDPNPNDGKAEPTIGIGHYMDRGDSRETFARVLPEVDYDSAYTGRTSLTNDQVGRLFNHDIRIYVERTKKLVPKFDELDVEVEKALVNMTYRGDLGDSPKTLALINSGRFHEASIEYKKRRDYRDAEKNGMSGLIRRIDSNSELLDSNRLN